MMLNNNQTLENKPVALGNESAPKRLSNAVVAFMTWLIISPLMFVADLAFHLDVAGNNLFGSRAESVRLAGNRGADTKALYHAMKRVMDFSIALVAVILASPVMLVAAIAVRLDSPGPIIFKQTRVGARRNKDGKWERVPFTIYKFRSMRNDADDSIHRQFIKSFMSNDDETMERINGGSVAAEDKYKIKNDWRVTRVGKFIRATSIDELPQLFNVLKGDMSLVGPRPALDYEVDEYQDWQLRRLEALPGITGLWQVKARSCVNFDKAMMFDVEYVEKQNLLMDIQILIETPKAVLSGKGAK